MTRKHIKILISPSRAIPLLLLILAASQAAAQTTTHLIYFRLESVGADVIDEIFYTNNASGPFDTPQVIVPADTGINPFPNAPLVAGGAASDVDVDSRSLRHLVYLVRTQRGKGVTTAVVYEAPSAPPLTIASEDTFTTRRILNNPRIAMGPQDFAHIIYHVIDLNTATPSEELRYAHNAAGPFSAPETIVGAEEALGIRATELTPASLSHGAIADLDIDSEGNWHLAYLTRRETLSAIDTNIKYKNATSPTPITIASGAETPTTVNLVGNPTIAIGPGNVVYLAYAQAASSPTRVDASFILLENSLGTFSSLGAVIVPEESLNIFRPNELLSRGTVADLDVDAEARWHLVFLSHTESPEGDLTAVLYKNQLGENVTLDSRLAAGPSPQALANPALATESALPTLPLLRFVDAENERAILGAATDGETLVLIEVAVPEGTLAANVVFEIDEADPLYGATSGLFENGSLGSELAAVTAPADAVSTSGESTVANLTYRVPDEFTRTGAHAEFDGTIPQRQIQFRVSINGNTFTAPNRLTLIRPPIVILHDLWSNAGQWITLYDVLRQTHTVVHVHDYSQSSDAALAANAAVASNAIDKALALARHDGFAATNVHIVAHGTGGLLARMYIQDLGQPFYRNDIKKLLTLATSHSGTPWGDLLTLSPFLQSLAKEIGEDLTQRNDAGVQVLLDLSVDNGVIETSLNHPGIPGRHLVPTHAMALQSPIETAAPWESVLAQAAFFLLKDSLPPEIDSPGAMLSALLGDAHDLIAGVPSQTGGLAPPATQTLTPFSHSTATSNPDIHETIRQLLDTPAADPLFDPLGILNPPNLSFPTDTFIPEEKGSPANIISIVDPADGATALPGATLPVALSAADTVEEVMVLTRFDSALLTGPPYATDITVPQTHLGPLQILAVARDTAGDLHLVTVTITVEADTAVETLTVLPESFLTLRTGEVYALNVSGVYTDGITRDISAAATGTTYTTSDSDIVAPDANGLLTAKNTGEVEITVTNNATAFVTVQVVPAEAPPPILITPSQLDFGTIFLNNRADMAFTITNTSAVIVEGTAATQSPFRVVFGGVYRLDPGQSRDVVLRFDPPAVGAFVREATFTANTETLHALVIGGAVQFSEGEGATEPFPPNATDCTATPALLQKHPTPKADILLLTATLLTLIACGHYKTRHYPKN